MRAAIVLAGVSATAWETRKVMSSTEGNLAVTRAPRGMVVAILFAAIASGLISASLIYAVIGFSITLPIPAGTVITQEETATWVVYFNVGRNGGKLVGAWTAFSGAGDIGPSVVAGFVPKPTPPSGPYNCPRMSDWAQANGTLDLPLPLGSYTMYWNTICPSAMRIVITQTFELLPS